MVRKAAAIRAAVARPRAEPRRADRPQDHRVRAAVAAATFRAGAVAEAMCRAAAVVMYPAAAVVMCPEAARAWAAAIAAGRDRLVREAARGQRRVGRQEGRGLRGRRRER